MIYIFEYNVDEIQNEMLVLLKRFHCFCSDNNIKYSVHAGTMIGIVREHGFIPWDDDADVSFTREEYNKFLGAIDGQDVNIAFEAANDEYFYFSLYDNAFPQLWMVRENKPAVWLDFFIYDFISEHRFSQKLKKAEIAFVLGFLKNERTIKSTKKRGTYRGLKYAMIYCAYLLGCVFPKKWKYDFSEKIRQSHPGNKSLIHRSNDRYSGVTFTYPVQVMGEYITMPFEDTALMVTKKYDDILVPSYGNYMTPVKDDTVVSGVHGFNREYMPFKAPAIRLNNNDLKKLKELELMCLREFDRICKKNGIQYFLGGGTLLGAVRHGGFIPWDDDIDVMMLPKEYEKFRKVVDLELDNRFIYQCKENDPQFHSIFDKIRLKDTIFDTWFSKQFDLTSHGIFIDIFVHDYISDNKYIQKLHIFKTILCRSFVRHKWDDSPMHFYGRLKLICKIASLYKKTVSMEKLEYRQMKTVTKYNGRNTRFLYDSRGEHTKNGVFLASILTDGAIDMSFEGINFPVPKRFDEYLEFSYGKDYMTLPPKEERIPGHDLARLDFGEYKNEN